MHPLLLHNSDIRDTRQPLISPGQTGYMTGWGVFSTLRVCQGVLFAFERHYSRMQEDARRLRIPFPFSAGELESRLLALVEANRACEATLRVSIVRNRGGAFEGEGITRDVDVVAFTSDLRDWGSGVTLSYLPHARHSASPYAGAKINSWAENLAWYDLAHERGFDEFILLNEAGQVSECTSANVFIIHEDEVLTPSLQSSGCLPGVTRAILLDELRIPGVTIRERDITPSELEAARQVFITSSTRDLLPVFEVDGYPLGQDQDTLELLRTAFQQYRERYVRARTQTLSGLPAVV